MNWLDKGFQVDGLEVTTAVGKELANAIARADKAAPSQPTTDEVPAADTVTVEPVRACALRAAHHLASVTLCPFRCAAWYS